MKIILSDTTRFGGEREREYWTRNIMEQNSGQYLLQGR